MNHPSETKLQKKSRSLHHKLFMYKICSASFFSLQDYLGRQHIIEAPSIKATKDVHIALKGGEKLLKLSIPVWCWQWNCSRNGFHFWKISRSYEKDWPKWWSLGCRNWDSSHETPRWLNFRARRIVLRCHDPMKITHDLETGILPRGIPDHHWSIGEQASKHLKLLPDIVNSSFVNSETETWEVRTLWFGHISSTTLFVTSLQESKRNDLGRIQICW